MKHLQYSFQIFSLVLLASLVLGCNAAKTSINNMNVVNITLKKGLTGTYLMQKYKVHHIVSAQKSNKTLNQYNTAFKCAESKLVRLKELMAKDKNIVSFSISNSTIKTKAEASENVQHAKTKSIKNKNK